MLSALGAVLVYLLVVGMAAGWFAWIVLGKSRVLMRADKKPDYAALLGLGVAGSFIGGLGLSFLLGDGLTLRPSGMIASAVGSIVVVAIYLWAKGRSR